MHYARLARNSKVPVKGELQISDDPQVIAGWKGNIGFLPELNNCVVVDFDRKEAGREFFKSHRDIIRTMVETRRGVHFYFSGKTNTRKILKDGEEIGDIKGNGHVVFPPSIAKGWKYKFVEGYEMKELCPFPEELFPQKIQTTVNRGTINRPLDYISPIFAIADQGRHNTTFRVACILRDVGFSEAEALAAMIPWNETNVSPQWTLKELLHKVRSAFNHTLKEGK